MRTIGLVFVDRFADWEFGFLSAAAAGWCGARIVALTPGARPVRSAGGIRLEADRGLDPAFSADLDAVAVIGSDRWTEPAPPDPGPLLGAVAGRGGVVGGICAGTLAVARAGLFEGSRHTSNGRVWIADHLPEYPGARHYVDVAGAVTDGRIVSAAGSAPVGFAAAFIEALMPEAAATAGQLRALFAREHADR